jgi:hypothetical protein
MFEQIYKMDRELTANQSRSATLRTAKANYRKAGDLVVEILRGAGDVIFFVLMIVIVVAQPIWVSLLTSFVYS